ncbi:hypothetical protein ABSZ42_004893 [Salmonella enterica subsp. enterica serovar Newport]
MKRPTKRGDTTVRVSEERKLEIKMKIIEIGSRTGEIIKTTDITNHLIDNYLNDAVNDIISDIEMAKKKI